jgi:predicted dehydrogenase
MANHLKRRDVLKAGLYLGGAGSLLYGAAAAQEPRLRCGFIGVGGRGTALLRNTLELPGVEVTAICDIDSGNLNRAVELVQKTRGAAPATFDRGPDDYKRLLEQKEIDAVVMATPCDLHARMFLDSIAAGKHIYGEKPMALSVKDATAIVEAEGKSRLVVQVGMQWMANRRVRETIRRIHAGEIGSLIEGRFARANRAQPLRRWFSNRERSGDWMLEQAVHELNVMNWVAQATPLRAYALGRSDLFRDGDPERNVTDYYTAIMEYPNGFIMHYTHGWISPAGFTGMELKVIGDQGAADITGGSIMFRDEQKQPVQLDPSENDTRTCLAAFVESIRAGTKPICPVSNGRDAVFVGLLLRRAVYQRREVTWKEMLETS